MVKGEIDFIFPKSAKVGDYIKFGSYPQTGEILPNFELQVLRDLRGEKSSNYGEIKPIEWQVLSIENGKMLVISRYGLDVKPFDSSSKKWVNSEIRKWLNGDFYNKAFSADDKKYISLFNIDGLTTDHVFLLSKYEAEKYFADCDARRCKPTGYAIENGADVAKDGEDKGYGSWWLRSPNPIVGSNSVYDVGSCGYISEINFVRDDSKLVRPALWINL